MTHHPEISVVVPVMNEAGNIAPLIHAIDAAFSKRSIEIIYVNDASTDSTLDELKAEKAKRKHLRVINHSKRSGQSAALRTGILSAKADRIATLDGDGQNPPADLVNLEQAWQKAKQHHLMVMAAGVRQKRQDSLGKRVASRWARRLRAWLLGDSHPDSGCGIKVFDRALFLRMPYFNHIHRFMPILAKREGAEVLAVPVSHAARQIGNSKYGNLDRLLVGIADIRGVRWLMRRSPKMLETQELE
ncbi:MAG: glycosyltransferase [Candidatus Puniceispirillales bacterium]